MLLLDSVDEVEAEIIWLLLDSVDEVQAGIIWSLWVVQYSKRIQYLESTSFSSVILLKASR